ncbi:MAG TPA: autotransporter-associated beta strand repeat-containing protein [Gemmatales bacterium]|nr:autotransporter-associated beta strand repeat-containing protein [Gemmatales bacterium]
MGITWFSRQAKRITKKQRLASACPRIEVLEDRLALATRVWDGNALSNNWSNAFNWAGDIAPVAGDDIVFPAGAFNDNKVADNNFPDGTQFHSINFQGGGFIVKGNRIVLGSGGITDNGSSNVLKLDVTLSAPTTIRVGSNLLFTGNLTGLSSTFSLTKTGTGTLVLEGNNSYLGETFINEGTVLARSETALGSSSKGTTVNKNGKLTVEDVVAGRMHIAEPLNTSSVSVDTNDPLNGPHRRITIQGDVDLLGALNLGGGGSINNKYSDVFFTEGNVTLQGPLTYGGNVVLANSGPFDLQSKLVLTNPLLRLTIDADFSDAFVISGQITGQGQLFQDGGVVRIAGNVSNSFSGFFTTNAGNLVLDKSNNTIAMPTSLHVGLGHLLLKKPNQIDIHQNVSIARGSFDLGGNNQTINNLSLLEAEVETRGVVFNGTLTVSGNIDVLRTCKIKGDLSFGASTRTINVSNDQNLGPGRLDLEANITATGSNAGLTKTGDGALVLSGNNSYRGSTNINGGIVRINGNQPNSKVNVFGGTLQGKGKTGSVDVFSGAHVKPGTSTDFGILHVAGDLNFRIGSILDVTLNNPVAGLGFDQIEVSGPGNTGTGSGIVHFNGTILQVKVGLGNAIGDTFRIINNDDSDVPAGETFASTTQSSVPQSGVLIAPTGERFIINYTGSLGNNDLVLTRTTAGALFPNRSVTPQIIAGSVVTLTGIVSDPDRKDSFILHINWGDGSPVETKVYPPSFQGKQVYLRHRYLSSQDDPYVIQLNWHDQRGAGNSDTLTTLVTPTARAARTTDAIFASLLNLKEKKNSNLLGS